MVDPKGAEIKRRDRLKSSLLRPAARGSKTADKYIGSGRAPAAYRSGLTMVLSRSHALSLHEKAMYVFSLSKLMSAEPAKKFPTEFNPELLVEEHGDYLYRYAFRYFRNEDAARDLVQDVLFEALRGAKNFSGQSSLRTWLTAILKHRIIDAIRKKSREGERYIDLDVWVDTNDLFDKAGHWHKESQWDRQPDAVLEERELLRFIADCLNKVPEKLRQLFLLREVEDLPREDLCKLFQLSTTNVGVLLHRVRLKLRDCLEQSLRPPL